LQPSAKPTPRPHIKAKLKKRMPLQAKVERKPVPALKEPEPHRSVVPVDLVGARTATKSDGSLDRVVLLVMSGLAILCFAVAAIPWALVPSRVAYYVAPRQTDLTLLGLILLVTAGFTFVLTRGL
jgi:hypothetical protein